MFTIKSATCESYLVIKNKKMVEASDNVFFGWDAMHFKSDSLFYDTNKCLKFSI